MDAPIEPTRKSILSSVPTYKRGRYIVVPYWFRIQWIGWQLSIGRMLVGRWVNWYAVAIGPLRISLDLPPAPRDPFVRGYFVGVAESQKLLHDAESALQQARSELDALKAQIAQAKETEQ